MIAAAAGAAIAGAGILTYAVRGRSSSLLAPSVYKGVTTRRAIALTFDDGPSESTPRLLESLHRHGASATFFQCGANVRRLPAVTQEVAAAGHEIGNHSDTHPYLCLKGAGFILDEITRAQESIEQTAAVRPKLFRAPYGVRWFGLREAQRRRGLLGVMWTAIGVDWKGTHDRVTAFLNRAAMNGAIFCLHDGRMIEPRPDIRVTLRAVERLLPMLLDKGYHFERVSDIICPTI
jgi:peptidoglycan/xylan/chitin deacetylase (PgdA/CDA1 family)